ncbi:lipopolysaccharide core biosynthesis protein rfaS, partial [Escherichia coli]|nr:lipopolysaccharide core biosynthesis protein rfaS [Escherichia coli]
KLITNNPNVVKYNFYNSNNIMIIEDKVDNVSFNEFINSSYQEIEQSIKNEYDVEFMLDTIFQTS